MTEEIYHVEVTVRMKPHADSVTDRLAGASQEIIKLRARFVKNIWRRPARAKDGTYQIHLWREEVLPALGHMLGRHGIVVVSHRHVTGNGILPPGDNTLAR